MCDINDLRGCRVSFELTCGNCGAVMACDRHKPDYIARELIASEELGFGALLAALTLAGWNHTVHQIGRSDSVSVMLRATAYNQLTVTDREEFTITAVWEHGADGWAYLERMTGYQPIDNGRFRHTTPKFLTRIVTQNPASWVRAPHGD